MIIECLQRKFPGTSLVDISDILDDMRMVKSPEEIAVMRQAGQVAIAMCEGGVKAIAEGVPEYEVALGVYQKAGFGICYRTGRAIGHSFLEKPEFKDGDKTPLQAGMTFAVDGGITIPGEFGARVGDSIVVTENGFEYLTPYPKELRIL
jgi:Xaa-Pro aminopeptidase